MIRDLTVPVWKVLRHLARSGPTDGNTLRWLAPCRHNKNGTWLDRLEALGLVERTGTAHAGGGRATKWPEQHRAEWQLTDKGRQAAEFGEYEKPDPVRTPAPEKGKTTHARA